MTFEHVDGLSIRAVFQEIGASRYRYLLEATSNAPRGSKTACFVMQNPSIADERQADRSAQFVEKLVFQKGLPEFNEVSTVLVVNQFGLIQTTDFSGSADHIGPDNDRHVISALERSDIVVLAWGASNGYEERKSFVLGELRRMPRKTVFLAAKHPSRASYEGFLKEFSV